jgi:methyl-accepting chemotaxis protein
MNTPTSQTEPTPPADKKPTHRAISDPREVATVVMARMNQVNAKKDELAAAINGLVDITQQLTRTYAEQLLAIEQLRRRVKALEAAAAPTTPADPSATVQ